MKKSIVILLLLSSLAAAAERRAKNVILFIGDAAGIPTLNAASIYRYNAPGKLFIQHMPHLGLMDTSASDVWVTDSAAAMTAIVTGQKTNNGVLSQSAVADRGKQEGEPLQTILEHAEERGLSTGVISNSPMWDATPAACYAHSKSRSKAGEIFAQILTPRFGDGVDLVIGAGRKSIYEATAKLGLDLDPALREKGFGVYDSLDAIPPDARRVVALFDNSQFDLGPVVERALAILSRNPKGFFLMVESDCHTNNIRQGLERVATVDGIIRQTVAKRAADTLVIFSADHSFDLRLQRGKRGAPLVPPPGSDAPATGKPALRMDDSHTGEEVLVGAAGPGSSRVQGFFANTDLFHIMMKAYGWETPRPAMVSGAGARD